MNLTKDERRMLLENSLERVMNTAREVALHAVHEDAGMVHDDLTHLKPLATKLWNDARNEAFKQENPQDGPHE